MIKSLKGSLPEDCRQLDGDSRPESGARRTARARTSNGGRKKTTRRKDGKKRWKNKMRRKRQKSWQRPTQRKFCQSKILRWNKKYGKLYFYNRCARCNLFKSRNYTVLILLKFLKCLKDPNKSQTNLNKSLMLLTLFLMLTIVTPLVLVISSWRVNLIGSI